MGAVSKPLIQWFELNRRLLPFRQEPSAYHIWVSEIMLQQTRVSAALPYYERFVAELPDPAALAACDGRDLLDEIAGLQTLCLSVLGHGNSHGDLVVRLAHQNSHSSSLGIVTDGVAHAAQGVLSLIHI